VTALRTFSCRRALERKILVPKRNTAYREYEFKWTPLQEAMRQRLFLPNKWRHTASERTAYGLNIHLMNQRYDKRLRTPKRKA
jgi:hypothetical protein